ncbi:MAG: sigma-70 family RNA polymerase sigma factor [Bacteroidota bacterium]
MNLDFKDDKSLVQAIKSGKNLRELALKEIYNKSKFKSKVKQFILSNSGNAQDAEDMIQEGIIVLDKNIRNNKFKGESSLDVYLTSICKFLWMNQIRKKSRVDLSDDFKSLNITSSDHPGTILMDMEKNKLLESLMDQLGKKCKQVLSLWKLSYSMPEIAEITGLSSEAMARKTKYNCMKKLKAAIINNPDISTLLKN